MTTETETPRRFCMACRMGMHVFLCEFGTECACGCVDKFKKESKGSGLYTNESLKQFGD